MTPSRRAEQLVWGMTGLAVVLGALVMRREVTSLTVHHLIDRPARSSPRGAAAAPAPRVANDLLRAILDGDLFRPERQAPDSVPAPPPAQAAARPPAPPKPRLVLQGLVGGPPWDAIVQGLPGHEGSYVVRAGDSVGGLKIRSVRRGGATIRGMDTTWVLTLGHTP